MPPYPVMILPLAVLDMKFSSLFLNSSGRCLAASMYAMRILLYGRDSVR